MGETRVDLLHLLEDLRDAYPGPTEETILAEIVANALDSGATRVTIATDPAARTLTIADDGAGMRRRELARYHDIASSSKVRGAGIGFAGVGIKIALLVCDEVVTETRRSQHHVASAWRLMSRHKATWRWVTPPGTVTAHGTAVRLQAANPLSPLLDPGFIEASLRRHFQPLDLADEFPLLASLVEQRAGGQRRLPVAAATPRDLFTGAALAVPLAGATTASPPGLRRRPRRPRKAPAARGATRRPPARRAMGPGRRPPPRRPRRSISRRPPRPVSPSPRGAGHPPATASSSSSRRVPKTPSWRGSWNRRCG